MSDADQSMDVSSFAQQVVSEYLDDEYQPSPNCLKTNGWAALVLGDIINVMEAEWLSNAIREIGATEIVGIVFEYNGEPKSQTVAVDRDSILAFNWENCYLYVLLIDRGKRFLYYKDQGNHFCVLCGPSSFVRTANPCSYDSARKMYEGWAYDEFRKEEERQEYDRIWKKYAEFKSE